MSLPAIDLGGGAGLRGWRPDDAAALSREAGDAEVWRWMSDGFPHPYTEALARHWVTQGHLDFGGDNFAVVQDGAVVGGCGVRVLDGALRCNAEVGWWIGRQHWGRGVGARAAAAMVSRGFDSPGVCRVFAPIHAGNRRSMRVAQKAGMVLEGMQPCSALKAGRVIDIAVYARYRDPGRPRP